MPLFCCGYCALARPKHSLRRVLPGCFVLAARDGLDEQLLEAQRGHARKFKRLERGRFVLEVSGRSGR